MRSKVLVKPTKHIVNLISWLRWVQWWQWFPILCSLYQFAFLIIFFCISLIFIAASFDQLPSRSKHFVLSVLKNRSIDWSNSCKIFFCNLIIHCIHSLWSLMSEFCFSDIKNCQNTPSVCIIAIANNDRFLLHFWHLCFSTTHLYYFSD